MITTSRCLALTVAILSSGFPVTAQTPGKTDATTILNNMVRMYSRLASYQDEGILITTIDEPTGGTIEKMPFKTFFKRPKLFRFEWTDFTITKLGQLHVIWFNGKEAFTYWEPDLYEKNESVGLAIAGATGISSGTATTVSDLLMPDEVGGSSLLKRLTKPSLVGEEVFEGVLCYRVQAIDTDESVELWVGKTDLLLRKVKRETKDGDGLRTREEIRRKIRVDQSIPEVVFNYKPPIAITPKEDIDTAALDRLLNPGPPVWTEFRSEEGRFSVLMPEKPQSQTMTMEMPQGRFEQHLFSASHSKLFCMIAYTEMPKQSLVGNNAEGFLDGVRDVFVKQVGGKLASESPLTLDGHPGREVKAHVFQGEARFRLFLVGERLYILWVMTLEKSSDSIEETFNKFFMSFKLISPPKRVAVWKKSYRDASGVVSGSIQRAGNKLTSSFARSTLGSISN
jgi:outer membrane lipoprotein-sorting protein